MVAQSRRAILVVLLGAFLVVSSAPAAEASKGWSWARRLGCGLVLSIPLAGFVGWQVYNRQDAANPIVAENLPWQPPPVIVKTGETPFMAEAQQEALFSVHDGKENHPVMTFFGKTRLQRFLSRKINQAAKDAEKNPDIKKKHEVTDYLKLAFYGLAFKRVEGDPNRVHVTLIGEIYETPLPDTYDVRDLAAGKPVTLRYDVPKQSYLGLGSGSGGTHLEVEYDARLGVLRVRRIYAYLKVESLLGNSEDDAEVKEMAATRGKPVERKPQLTANDVNK